MEKPLPGDILIFLPGQEDIEKCADLIQKTMDSVKGEVREVVLAPIFSSLPAEQQRKIYDPTPEGCRKIVVATNIAETSITVNGIVYVLDSGLCKQKFYDPRSSMESLVVVPISRASAEQRKGRAGRTQPGECLRLYTKYMFLNDLAVDPVPEIARSNLAAIVLNLKAIGVGDPGRV